MGFRLIPHKYLLIHMIDVASYCIMIGVRLHINKLAVYITFEIYKTVFEQFCDLSCNFVFIYISYER